MLRVRTLSPEGTRRHIRGALEAGASRDEILMILKIASLLSIHTCSLGAPILLEEAKATGVKPTPKTAATPVCDKMKAAGQWNSAWDAFFEIAPAWTEAIIAASLPVYTSGVLSPKLAELLSIAVDASINHMYAPGTRRHIQTALKLGATMEEIMEVLKICVAQGIQACNLGVPDPRRGTREKARNRTHPLWKFSEHFSNSRSCSRCFLSSGWDTPLVR